jgi:uncharacterized protein (TIGR02145 family)
MQKKTHKLFYLIIVIALLLTNSCKKDDNNNDQGLSGTVTDIDGNVYHTVTIGTQTWMVENLKTTHFNDSTAIPLVESMEWTGLKTSGYCWYNNNSAMYKATYGALYNWYAASNSKICPKGWHVPSNDEWATLINYLGGESEGGGKLKETGTTHWTSPNSGTDNSKGFTALPGGNRYYGNFLGLGTYGIWWSSTEFNSAFAWYRTMLNSENAVPANNINKTYGFSIRCLKGEKRK